MVEVRPHVGPVGVGRHVEGVDVRAKDVVATRLEGVGEGCAEPGPGAGDENSHVPRLPHVVKRAGGRGCRLRSHLRQLVQFPHLRRVREVNKAAQTASDGHKPDGSIAP